MNTPKTKLCFELADNSVKIKAYGLNYHWKENAKGELVQRQKSTLYGKAQYETTEYNGMITDTATAYIISSSTKMTYVALRTIYKNAPHSMILNLMNECVSIGMSYGVTQHECETYYANHIDDFLPDDLAVYTDDNGVLHLENNAERNDFERECHYMDVKTHKDGSKSFHKTVYGKLIDNCYAADNDLDCMDIIQTASMAIVHLIRIGLINSFADIWNYRSYVYNRVNAYIHNGKKHSISNESYDNIITVYGEKSDIIFGGKRKDNLLDNVLYSDMVQSIIVTLDDLIPDTHTSKTTMISIFALTASGADIKQVARLLDKPERTVYACITRLYEICKHDPIINQTLHDLIIGNIG